MMNLPSDMNGMTVLDLGCNLGAFCLETYKRGAVKVMGVVKEQDYINCARDLARYNNARINYRQFDLNNGRKFVDYIKRYFRKTVIDVVFALSLYKHLADMMFKIIRSIKWKVCYIESHSTKNGLDSGLLRVFYFEKGPAYYSHNPFFWIKMVAFLIVGLLSIDPTMQYVRWNKTLKEGRLPETPDREYKRTRLLLTLEVIGLAVILFAAALMARGIGMI